jgi:ring-1,2-phenylacetyl-CoA epoxidase subunit PaaD
MVVDQFQDIDPKIIEAIRGVSDPEIPVLSVLDMGIVRAVDVKDNQVHIKITPTYSGCPAMDTIGVDIQKAVEALGYEVTVELVLHPAWTTDWLTENGRKELMKYGISPPLEEAADKMALLGEGRVVPCPRCQSTNTKMISQFGSTACKALFKCDDCLEVFDYFKCLK